MERAAALIAGPTVQAVVAEAGRLSLVRGMTGLEGRATLSVQRDSTDRRGPGESGLGRQRMIRSHALLFRLLLLLIIVAVIATAVGGFSWDGGEAAPLAGL